MFRQTLVAMVLGFFISAVVLAEELRLKPSDVDLAAVRGLWEGTWGGGQRNGVIFPPVIATLAIHGNRAVWWGLPQTSDDRGSIGFSEEAKGKTLRLIPGDKPDGQARKDVVSFSYALKGDELTLAVGEAHECSLARKAVPAPPLANVAVEFVTAEGLSESGDLRVTRFRSRHVASLRAEYFEPQPLIHSTKDASIYRVEKQQLKKTTVDQARQILKQPMPVVVTHRQKSELPPRRPEEQGQDQATAPPDSEPVLAMLKSLLGEGTLVFVLPPERPPVP